MSYNPTSLAVAEQRNWGAYQTLSDAYAAIRFKQPGLQVYIISEDLWYYWKESTSSFVAESSGGGGESGPVTLTGEATGSGTGSFAVTLDNDSVIAKVLTGYSASAGIVSASDSILTALQKIDGNIAGIVGAVASVNGETGDVILTTTDIEEGDNLYYTDTRFNDAFATKSTTNLSEGTNLYYTDARFNTAFGLKTTSDLSEGSNLYYTAARFDTAFATKTTTNLTEGTNLYWTPARFDSRLALKTTTDLTEGANLYWTPARFDTRLATKSTTDLIEGSNLYYTTARFDTAFATKTTTNLTEGSNLYFTHARSIISPLTGYVSGAGVISAADTIIGAIQKLNGNVSAITVLPEIEVTGATIDGQGGVIQTGVQSTILIPFSGTITGWTIMEVSKPPISCSITVDAWKDTLVNYPPTVSDSIFGTKPSLSSATTNSASGLSIAVTAGDIIIINVDSVVSAVKVLIVFNLTRTA